MNKPTTRMKEILKWLKEHDGMIWEQRDAFLEKSTFRIRSHTEFLGFVKSETLHKMLEMGLIVELERVPRYSKSGQFLTSESRYCIPEHAEK